MTRKTDKIEITAVLYDVSLDITALEASVAPIVRLFYQGYFCGPRAAEERNGSPGIDQSTPRDENEVFHRIDGQFLNLRPVEPTDNIVSYVIFKCLGAHDFFPIGVVRKR